MSTNFTCDQAKPSPEICSFHKEIASMLHGFGDVATPLTTTVTLVESIVLKQLRGALYLAAKNADRRGSKCVCPEDIFFLARNSKVKLKRMLIYLKTIDNIKKNKMVDEQYIPNVLLEEDSENMKKRKRSYNEIVEAIGGSEAMCKDLDIDEVILSRKLRANKISQSLTLEKYETYHKARRVSFYSRMNNYVKLKQWICPANDVTVSNQSMDLLAYVAYETVAQIMDLCFLVRQDFKSESSDPFAKLEGGNYCNLSTYDSAHLIKSGYGVIAITPSLVREALRRFYAPVIGINGLFSRNIRCDMPTKFLAL